MRNKTFISILAVLCGVMIVVGVGAEVNQLSINESTGHSMKPTMDTCSINIEQDQSAYNSAALEGKVIVYEDSTQDRNIVHRVIYQGNTSDSNVTKQGSKVIVTTSKNTYNLVTTEKIPEDESFYITQGDNNVTYDSQFITNSDVDSIVITNTSMPDAVCDTFTI